ncbi:MAG: threonylcarbamoyl-AMP synthase [Bacteroidales bacterium]|nr:threonylcarbamoyl-AMP synthase [Bacteroidales bacterium]
MEELEVLETAQAALMAGNTILYPTDTIWGVGCDATNAAAVEKVYALKQRDHSKSMLVLCSEKTMVEHFVGPVDERVGELLFGSERPTTVIMPVQNKLLADNIVAADGTIGVRVPKMSFCQKLLRLLGRPIVSSSANLSGRPSPASYADIEEELKYRIDFCVPAEYEEKTAGHSSRIVKLMSDGSIFVIRD